MRPLQALFWRDLLIALRRPGEVLTSVVFYLLSLALFPLGVGAAPDVLSRIGAGVLWVLALLGMLLTLERIWQADVEDGTLEQMLLARTPLELLVLTKALAHWLTSGLFAVLVSPLLTVLLAMPQGAWRLVPVSLLLGTPTLTLIGQIGAALLIGARRGSVLLGLLVMPLYIPVLIFGVGAVDSGLMGLGSATHLLILGALLLLAMALAPLATAAALRLAAE